MECFVSSRPHAHKLQPIVCVLRHQTHPEKLAKKKSIDEKYVIHVRSFSRIRYRMTYRDHKYTTPRRLRYNMIASNQVHGPMGQYKSTCGVLPTRRPINLHRQRCCLPNELRHPKALPFLNHPTDHLHRRCWNALKDHIV